MFVSVHVFTLLSQDGSIMRFAEVELAYGRFVAVMKHSINLIHALEGNVGLDEIVYEQRAIALKHGVSFGDMCVAVLDIAPAS